MVMSGGRSRLRHSPGGVPGRWAGGVVGWTVGGVVGGPVVGGVEAGGPLAGGELAGISDVLPAGTGRALPGVGGIQPRGVAGAEGMDGGELVPGDWVVRDMPGWCGRVL